MIRFMMFLFYVLVSNNVMLTFKRSVVFLIIFHISSIVSKEALLLYGSPMYCRPVSSDQTGRCNFFPGVKMLKCQRGKKT